MLQRFQRLYNAYEQEDIAEKQQIVALHQQRVQSDLNQRKRVAMDKYMRSLEKGDVSSHTLLSLLSCSVVQPWRWET